MIGYYDIKKNHKIILDLYKELQSICIKHGLRYFAISGTTIGAVLWNGIIPWDDDMDIALPAEDYMKLVKICKSGELSSKYGFMEYVWFGGKLFDKRTMFTNVYYLDKPEKFIGVSIDIVPLINIPNEKHEQEKFVSELKNFHIAGRIFDVYGIVTEGYSESILKRKQENFLNAFKFGETNYVMDFSDDRYILKASGFNEPVIMKFENTTIPVSSNYDEDLTIQYGKYTKDIPEDQRESFHLKCSVVDLNKSCNEYAKTFKKSSAIMKEIVKIKHSYEGYCEDSSLYKDVIIDQLKNENKKLIETNNELTQKLNKRLIVKLLNRIKGL